MKKVMESAFVSEMFDRFASVFLSAKGKIIEISNQLTEWTQGTKSGIFWNLSFNNHRFFNVIFF